MLKIENRNSAKSALFNLRKWKYRMPYYHTNTTNDSFLEMYKSLKDMEVKNNKFFLNQFFRQFNA